MAACLAGHSISLHHCLAARVKDRHLGNLTKSRGKMKFKGRAAGPRLLRPGGYWSHGHGTGAAQIRRQAACACTERHVAAQGYDYLSQDKYGFCKAEAAELRRGLTAPICNNAELPCMAATHVMVQLPLRGATQEQPARGDTSTGPHRILQHLSTLHRCHVQQPRP